jgi:hypothetical protein
MLENPAGGISCLRIPEVFCRCWFPHLSDCWEAHLTLTYRLVGRISLAPVAKIAKVAEDGFTKCLHRASFPAVSWLNFFCLHVIKCELVVMEFPSQVGLNYPVNQLCLLQSGNLIHASLNRREKSVHLTTKSRVWLQAQPWIQWLRQWQQDPVSLSSSVVRVLLKSVIWQKDPSGSRDYTLSSSSSVEDQNSHLLPSQERSLWISLVLISPVPLWTIITPRRIQDCDWPRWSPTQTSRTDSSPQEEGDESPKEKQELFPEERTGTRIHLTFLTFIFQGNSHFPFEFRSNERETLSASH